MRATGQSESEKRSGKNIYNKIKPLQKMSETEGRQNMLRKRSVQQKESEDQFNFTRHYVTSGLFALIFRVM